MTVQIDIQHDSLRNGKFPSTEDIGIEGIRVHMRKDGFFNEIVTITISDIEEGGDVNSIILQLGMVIGGKIMSNIHS